MAVIWEVFLDIPTCPLACKKKSSENNPGHFVYLPFACLDRMSRLLWLIILQSHLAKLYKENTAALAIFDHQFTCNWHLFSCDTNSRFGGYYIESLFIHIFINCCQYLTYIIIYDQIPNFIKPNKWKFMQHKDTHMRTDSHTTQSTLINIMDCMPTKA